MARWLLPTEYRDRTQESEQGEGLLPRPARFWVFVLRNAVGNGTSLIKLLNHSACVLRKSRYFCHRDNKICSPQAALSRGLLARSATHPLRRIGWTSTSSPPTLPPTLCRTRPAGPHLSYASERPVCLSMSGSPHTTNTNTNYYDGPTSDRKGIQ